MRIWIFYETFDIIEIPLEGVAAYWLSIKKLADEKRSFKPLGEEAEYTSEPYIRYLLDVVFLQALS